MAAKSQKTKLKTRQWEVQVSKSAYPLQFVDASDII